MRYLHLAGVIALAIAGCARDEREAGTSAAATGASPSADRARAAALVANAIAANPSAADSILTAGGHTRDSFERLMFEIAADSAMSAVYASAKTR